MKTFQFDTKDGVLGVTILFENGTEDRVVLDKAELEESYQFAMRVLEDVKHDWAQEDLAAMKEAWGKYVKNGPTQLD